MTEIYTCPFLLVTLRLLRFPWIVVCTILTLQGATVSWQTIEGNRFSPPFGWHYQYDIGFCDGILMVDIDIRLIGDPVPIELRDLWESGIETVWSTDRFEVPIEFNVDWSDNDYDLLVTVHEGNGTANLRNWYTGRASGLPSSYQGRVAAHEIGHQIGLWDESVGGAVNPETNLINTDGLMDDARDPTLDYYYDDLLEWYHLNVIPQPTTVCMLGVAGV